MLGRHFPLGHPIVESPHSVLLSLPTLADVIGYEERAEAVTSRILTGYPRFVSHPYIGELRRRLAPEISAASPESVFLTADLDSARRLLDHACPGAGRCGPAREDDFAWALTADHPEARERARLFQQHTGTGLSSRQAESALHRRGCLPGLFPEPVRADDAAGHIRRCLASLYDCPNEGDLLLCRGGMNAFHAAFLATQTVQTARRRHRWVRLGWLYVDTIRVMEKLGRPGDQLTAFEDPRDWPAIEAFFAAHGPEIAGVVTEAPNNPLVRVADIPRLANLTVRHGAALLLDPTLASPYNFHLLPWADFHINSLTKYAGNEGDVMAGALALNPSRPLYSLLRPVVERFLAPAHPRDLARLACEIDRYDITVRNANRSTQAVAEWLVDHPSVAAVHWTGESDQSTLVKSLARFPDSGPGAVLSFRVRGNWRAFYDRLAMPKSPSFGLRFSLLCPFLYLAHYDWVTTVEGRRRLAAAGLAPDLLRLSVGGESPADIQAVLSEALAAT